MEEETAEVKERKVSLTERVFAKVLSSNANNYCFDCGEKEPTFVSVNHGIFLCYNCAICIHQVHYPVEISFIKSIFDKNWSYP